MGVKPDWANKLAEVNPVWHEDTLWVSVDIVQDPTAIRKVANCILYVFKFKAYTESRWSTIGAACRGLVGALSVGLSEIVEIAKSLSERNWYLNGFVGLSEEVKRFACASSIVAWVPEGLMRDLMEDDRVLRRLPELEARLLEDLDFVEGLPNGVWRRLAAIYKSAGHSLLLRTEILRAAHSSVCFINRRIFSAAKSRPWSLALGSIQENVEGLELDDPASADPLTRNLFLLKQQGVGLMGTWGFICLTYPSLSFCR